MKSFKDWYNQRTLQEGPVGRFIGNTAGHVANVPGKVSRWIGSEIKDAKQGYRNVRQRGASPSANPMPRPNNGPVEIGDPVEEPYNRNGPIEIGDPVEAPYNRNGPIEIGDPVE